MLACFNIKYFIACKREKVLSKIFLKMKIQSYIQKVATVKNWKTEVINNNYQKTMIWSKATMAHGNNEK